MKNTIYTLLIIIVVLFACKRDQSIDLNPANKLNFSTDSVLFDTVFTSKGTTSRSFKVFNPSKNNIEISNIRLVGGATSAFKININGVAQTTLSNIKLNGKDSIYIFIKAIIDPNEASAPFLVQDTLEFLTNGNLQKIPVLAYGQNAVYLKATTISNDFTFTKKIPYIIFDNLKIAQNVTAIVEPGAKLYFHGGSELSVYGTLKVNGLLNDSVTFCSDRTERIYRDEPGQWKGIRFYETSINNTINYSTIKNAIVGLWLDSMTVNPKLLLTNSIVKNHTVAGMLAYNTHIVGINNLFYNCGMHLLAARLGGNYSFYQNTFYNSNNNFIRDSEAVYFSDNLEDNSNKFENLTLDFTNNIVWGSLDNEFLITQKGSKIFNVITKSNLLKTEKFTNEGNNVLNQDPLFEDSKKDNFNLASNSPALNIGFNLILNPYFNAFISKDLKGVNRNFPSDLGCLEIK
ncbi:MAG: hypothetical protein EAZ15_09280 [Sphingobacteriales bacterium]|nr:MAG: hypothetical protein EAZ15_09280 [Sphingobacteriales bacterium]